MNKHRMRYSIYDRSTDEPIIISATAKDCARVLGISVQSFWAQLAKTRQGKGPKSYEIFVDEPISEEELLS